MQSLEHYIKTGSLEDVKTIVAKGDLKFDFEWIDYDLLKTSITYKHKEISQFLIKNNFRANKYPLREKDETPLHLAVKLGWKDIIELLLEKGASVEVQDINGMTPVQLSFHLKKYDITDSMLPFDKGQGIPDSCADINHMYIACARNCVSAVKKYLQLGFLTKSFVHSEYSPWSGYTLLHFAVEFKSREVVELLLKEGVDITTQNSKGNTPLHIAYNLKDELLIDLILSQHKYVTKNPQNSFKLTHFHIACARNNLKVVYGFNQCGVNLNAESMCTFWLFPNPLHFAVMHKSVDVIKFLLAQNVGPQGDVKDFLLDVHNTENSEIINSILYKTNINSSFGDCYKNLPLFFKAGISQKKYIIERLINLGKPINECLPLDSPLWPGATILHIAIESQSEKGIINFLIKNGADITALDARGWTPIHLAFKKNRDALDCLLKEDTDLQLNLMDEYNVSLFHIACACGFESIVDRFLDIGVDVNAAISEDSIRFPGFTPLHMAASCRKHHVVRRLMDRGADATIRNRQGLAPLDLLLQTWTKEGDFVDDRHKTIVSIVTKVQERNYPNFDSRGFSLLHVACIADDESIIKRCIADGHAVNLAVDFSSAIYPGYTPLHFAAWQRNPWAIRTLLDLGADPAARTAEGDTPLHLELRWQTCREISFAMGKMMMLNCDDRLFLIDENPFGSDGFSHFHLACQFGKLHIVRSFLDRGLSPDLRCKTPRYDICQESDNRVGETGLHAAAFGGHPDVMQLLLDRGADPHALDGFLRTPLHVAYAIGNGAPQQLLLDRGADVDARDYAGATTLHEICRTGCTQPVIKAVLQAGGDINLEDAHGRTPLSLAMLPSKLTFVNTRLSLIHHVLRLLEARCNVSSKNVTTMRQELMPNMRYNDETQFRLQCLAELVGMRGVQLNRWTTLRDLLQIQDTQYLRLLVANKWLRRLVEDELEGLDWKYPNYGYQVRLQYSRGLKRRRLTAQAILALRALDASSCLLSEYCAEVVLRYLTDSELECLIEAVPSISSAKEIDHVPAACSGEPKRIKCDKS